MADVESAAAAFVENETPQQESSQDTQIVEQQAIAPTTPFEGLQSRLRDNPHDTVAWQDLINIAEDSGDLKLITTAYDSLLKGYPNTVSQMLLIPNNSRRVEFCS
jgi:cleavage stimulation factor subunit 3